MGKPEFDANDTHWLEETYPEPELQNAVITLFSQVRSQLEALMLQDTEHGVAPLQTLLKLLRIQDMQFRSTTPYFEYERAEIELLIYETRIKNYAGIGTLGPVRIPFAFAPEAALAVFQSLPDKERRVLANHILTHALKESAKGQKEEPDPKTESVHEDISWQPENPLRKKIEVLHSFIVNGYGMYEEEREDPSPHREDDYGGESDDDDGGSALIGFR